MLTKFEPNIISCDNLFDGGVEYSQDHEKNLALALGAACATLQTLHDIGYVHGDFQVKNTAFDRKTKQPRIIDTETLRLHEKIPDFVPRFTRDLRVYVYDIQAKTQNRESVSTEAIVEGFLNPYKNSINDIFPRTMQQPIRDKIEKLKLKL